MDELRSGTLWWVLFGVLSVFSVPWFWWGDATIVAGLPAWLWWHILWMGLAAIVFWAFTRTAWDRIMGVADSESNRSEPESGVNDV